MSKEEDKKQRRWENFLAEIGRCFPQRYDNYLADLLDESALDEDITVWERDENGEGAAHLKEHKHTGRKPGDPIDIESYRRRKN